MRHNWNVSHCKTPDILHVRKFIEYARRVLNDSRYYPPGSTVPLYGRIGTLLEMYHGG